MKKMTNPILSSSGWSINCNQRDGWNILYYWCFLSWNANNDFLKCYLSRYCHFHKDDLMRNDILLNNQCNDKNKGWLKKTPCWKCTLYHKNHPFKYLCYKIFTICNYSGFYSSLRVKFDQWWSFWFLSKDEEQW